MRIIHGDYIGYIIRGQQTSDYLSPILIPRALSYHGQHLNQVWLHILLLFLSRIV